MDRKELQEQRIRGYFIEATREILKGEGLKSVNVRAVAERAGYSYATLYNYFKDIKELIFICVRDFQNEAEIFITERSAKAKPGKERIREVTRNYIEFFVQYPGIFELFFLEKMGSIEGKHPTADMICTFLHKLTLADWEKSILLKEFTRKKALSRQKQLVSVSTGLLVLYLNRMYPGTYKEFAQEVEEQLSFILD